ncbi:MAG: metal ABC transporter ATP-binding protein [Rhodospirillales bacterium]|nr:metal ABC transporter ATP-binding protein [Rhodospirillales bacterium]
MIELRDVTAGYRLNPVFAHLSLKAHEGSFTGIVGPTGAGKTTLLRAILGLIPTTAGEVLVGGTPLSQTRPGLIGYVPQAGTTDSYFPTTVKQIILMGLAGVRRLTPWASRQENTKAEELAEKLGITPCLNHHISDISGGQQQRAFLARALIADPQVLVLDEPTAGVDLKTQNHILRMLAELNREGVTVIMTTHDLNAIAVHLPRVMCFNKGIKAEGAPSEVFTDDILRETFGEELMVLKQEHRIFITGRNPIKFRG